jgi:hypothetical protein
MALIHGFTARLYLTRQATKKAGLFGRMLFCTEANNRIYGIEGELVDYPFSALKGMLKQHGMSEEILNVIIHRGSVAELANAEAALQSVPLAA